MKKLAQKGIFENKIKEKASFLRNLWRKVEESGGNFVSLNPNSLHRSTHAFFR